MRHLRAWRWREAGSEWSPPGEGGFGDALVENFLRLGEDCGWDNLEWDRLDWNGFRSDDCCVLDRFGVAIGF